MAIPSRIMKVKFIPTYPVSLAEGTGIGIATATGTKTIGLDYGSVAATPGIADPATAQIVVYRQADETYELARLDQLVFPAAGQRTARGDADYTILTTDRVVALTASLTAPRTWTLPGAVDVAGGTAIDVIDEAGGIGPTNTLTITRSASDTINGATTSVLNVARTGVRLISDGISKWTIALVADEQLRPGTALSVIGRSANTTGTVADIAAATDGHVLRRSGTALGFGQVATDGITDKAVTLAKQADIATASVIGRKTAATGVPEVLAGSDVRDSILPSGFVVDRVYAEYTANTALTPQIPSDDTIPQVTEGTEILAVSITPKSTTNKLRIRWRGTLAISSTPNNVSVAAFVNGGSNAVAAEQLTIGDIDYRQNMTLEYEYTPGTTSAQAITIRIGGAGGTLRLNGASSSRLLGGAMRSTLIVEELKA